MTWTSWTADQARGIEAHCADLWQQRERITEQLSRQSAPGLDEQVADDLLDLAIVLANLQRLPVIGRRVTAGLRHPRRGSRAAVRVVVTVLAVEGGAHGRVPVGREPSRAARRLGTLRPRPGLPARPATWTRRPRSWTGQPRMRTAVVLGQLYERRLVLVVRGQTRGRPGVLLGMCGRFCPTSRGVLLQPRPGLCGTWPGQ